MIIKMRKGKLDGLNDLIEKLPNINRMIEVGSYTGESAELFATSGKIGKLYCVDPWEGGIIAGHDYRGLNPVVKAVNENFKAFEVFRDSSWMTIL